MKASFAAALTGLALLLALSAPADAAPGRAKRKVRRAAKERADKNDDGKLGPRERRAAKRKAREKVKDKADKNNDGKLGPRERARARALLGGERAFRKADENNDGKIDPREANIGERAFKAIDANKDGFLTRAEITKARLRLGKAARDKRKGGGSSSGQAPSNAP